MRQIPYRLLAVLAITLTLGGCVTYPATPVVVEETYIRETTPVYQAPPRYSYTVISDPGYRFYDDTLGVYVFYDRSDVFYRHGRYYRWYEDHWISANHWRGPWYPSPNLYISVNFHDHWHKRLRRHGHRYAGGRHHRPPRRHDHHDRYDRPDRHDGKDRRRERREDDQGRRRGREQGFAGIAQPKPHNPQADNRRNLREEDRMVRSKERRKDRHRDRRDARRDDLAVQRADGPLAVRDPRLIPAVERPGSDRRAVRDWPKPQVQRGQNTRRKVAVQPTQPQEGQQAKKNRKKADKKTDKRKQTRRAGEPLSRRANEARRRID